MRIRQRNAVLTELDQMANPPHPQPPPEPTEVVVVEEDQGPPKLGYPNLHRWF
jgi:hypothetical protein